MWVERARKEVEMPILGSINANSAGAWVEYAKELENAGCNGLELNLYTVEADPRTTASEVEERFLGAVADVASRQDVYLLQSSSAPGTRQRPIS